VVIGNLEIQGRIVASRVDTQMTLVNVKVICQSNSDAVSLHDCTGGKILLLGCEIIGGDDGLFISESPSVHVKATSIQMARSRGIIANDSPMTTLSLNSRPLSIVVAMHQGPLGVGRKRQCQ
jgi:hypothetical protein